MGTNWIATVTEQAQKANAETPIEVSNLLQAALEEELGNRAATGSEQVGLVEQLLSAMLRGERSNPDADEAQNARD